MSRVERDPERGRAAAAKLKALGVKGILIKEAEQGYITQLACKMPECFCPEQLGGACYFESVTHEWSDWRSDWMPTLEHFPVSKKQGGKAAVGQRHLGAPPLQSPRSLFKSWPVAPEGSRADQESPRGRDPPQQCLTGNTEGGEIPTVVATVEVIGEPADGTEPGAEAATLKAMQTKKAPEWKSLPDAEKAQYLLDHQTISDRTWTNEPRLNGEKRDAFIRRILLG